MPSADKDALVTGAEAARLIGESKQLVYSWSKRGLLTRQPDGRYRYGDVIEVERATRNNKHSTRNTRRRCRAQ